MLKSNKSGRAKKPSAKRFQQQTTAARMFRTLQAGPFLAPKLMTKLRYSQIVDLSNGIADHGMQQFRLNSVFDPDYTGGGSQPPYFDRMASIYSSYRVLSAKYRVRCAWKTGSNQVLAVWTSTVATAVANLQAALSQTDSRSLIAFSNSDPNDVLQKWQPIAKVMGVERAEIETDSDYGALISTNPTKQAYLNLYSGNLSGTATSTASALVEITYYVEWSNPVPDNMN